MSMIGTRVLRKEDPALLTGGARYIDDIVIDGALHATFVRSVMAHATISGIDADEARAMPGVAAVYTAADLELSPRPPAMPMFNADMQRTFLASDRVRYVGEPVAVVLSETREAGADAAEFVVVDYEPLPVLTSAKESANDELLLFPEAGTNTVFGFPAEVEGDIFADCDVVAEQEFHNHRQAPCPIEPRTLISSWGPGDDGRERLTQWSSTQNAHATRDGLAGVFGLEKDQVRVIAPDIGGGFGAKNGQYPEDMVVAMSARKLGRPVRWVEGRSESMVGLAHGRAWDTTVKIGGTRDGKILAYSIDMLADAGAYPVVGSILPMFGKMVATGNYHIPVVAATAKTVVTNTVPVGAYRGAGRPEAALAIERAIEVFAAELGMDPIEVRRKNFVAPGDFPYTTATGTEMDSGEYDAAVEKVMATVDYAGLRAEQQRRREDPDAPLLGLGWSAYIEIANPVRSGEYGSMQVNPDGSALLRIGTSPHGQGHYTAFAQVAAEKTGIPFDKITVTHGDTDVVPRGGGTGGSRSLQVGGSAVWQAAEAVIEKAKEAAADMLEANPTDIVHDAEGGSFAVVGTPASSKSWAEVAAHMDATESVPLQAEADFQPPNATFPFGAQLSIIEIDRDTGKVHIVDHISCDDAGTIVNPMIVEGQVHGGVASGLLHALMEEFVYDADGNPQTSNFMDYALGSAAELPSFTRIPQETPTDRNPIGAKGVGESGTIGATPALQNAVIDALSHLGVRHIELPLTSERVWRTMTEAGG
jgi:carbon-monoxide dehydrogenase large subunit